MVTIQIRRHKKDLQNKLLSYLTHFSRLMEEAHALFIRFLSKAEAGREATTYKSVDFRHGQAELLTIRTLCMSRSFALFITKRKSDGYKQLVNL